jgi:small subunit ribosomal protein S16
MVKIRLRRTGAKMKPSYRVVVADSHSPRDGAFIEIIGHFNPRTTPETVVINEERALNWLKQGAQPTVTAGRLLTKAGIMEKFKAGKEATKGADKEKS